LNSEPSYPHSHSGPCIVAGSALCLHDDLAQAWKIYPGTPVIAVNGAGREVKAFALFSYHPQRFIEKGFEWIRHQRRLFGPDFTVHGAKFLPDMPWVQYWHEKACGGGGSAWGARKVASLMGFTKVILCGCPMTVGNYASYRLGGLMTQKDVIDRYRHEIERDTKWLDRVYSMSGWTKEFFGSC
jgi:hypothetical protein